MKMYEVGGYVRDQILGIQSKDIDFTVVMENEQHHNTAETFDLMQQSLTAMGFEIFKADLPFLTVRARFPRDNSTWPQFKGLTADFVLSRKEGSYSDGRHPDEVELGTLEDDLARRDFTMNAIAVDPDTNIYIDPHKGIKDIYARVIRCVGDPEERLREDALRALRALRFAITKEFSLNNELVKTLRAGWLPDLLSSVSVERKREELRKMFHKDTIASMNLLYAMKPAFREAIFCDGLWLDPTLKS